MKFVNLYLFPDLSEDSGIDFRSSKNTSLTGADRSDNEQYVDSLAQ